MSTEPLRVPLPAEIAAESYRELRRAVRRAAAGERVVLDGAALTTLDALAAARLLRVIAEGRAAGRDVRLANLGAAARRALAEVDPAIL